MAGATSATTNYCNSQGSPFTNIAPDDIYTILLLLPVESIVSLSMTCKRLRALITSSHALWESICRRDWGSVRVDAIKSSNRHHQQQLCWMSLYKQVSQLEYVSCHKLSDPGGDLDFPTSRASHSLNFVSDCLVLFGGGCEGGRHLDDTWVAYVGNDLQRVLRWKKVCSGIPSGRFGHTCVELGDFLVLFGGINDRGNRQNDTWIGQVGHEDTLGFTLSWRLLDVGVIAPPPRGAHAACCVCDKRMVINGGIGMNGMRLGDTWILELSDDRCSGTWYEIACQSSPPARSGHTLTRIGRARIVLFGGRGMRYKVLNDIWLLYVCEDCLKWVEILYELQNIPGGVSLPRVGHSATVVLGGWLLIHGGEDSHRHRKNDFWVLDIRAIPLTVTSRQGSLSSPRVELARVWRHLRSDGYRSNCRSFHRACADHSGRYLYVFGGMVDGILQPTEPSGLKFDREHFLVELMLQL